MKKNIIGLLTVMLLQLNGFSQTSNDSILKKIDQNAKIIEELKDITEKNSRLKVSGLFQGQLQFADAVGTKSYAGGDFPANSNYRFGVKRGRIKTVYSGNLTQYVFQIDASDAGVTLRDVYMEVTEPWMKTVSLTGGIFFRPFGYELELSETIREAPERARIIQILFPQERDLGSMIRIAPKNGCLKYFNLRGGLFAGNGIAPENDKNKDFIGRFGFHIPIPEQTGLTIAGRMATYVGKVMRDNGTVGGSKIGSYSYNPSDMMFHTLDSNSFSPVMKRQYLGFDLELVYKMPVLGPMSLRAEYIFGIQPGTATSSAFYKSYQSVSSGNLFMRNFAGYFITWSQYFGPKNQLILHCDSYDPNTRLTGNQINAVAGSMTGYADIKYTTFGLGWAYFWDNNIKFMLYYDLVRNEECPNMAGYTSDIADNVVTFRMQYKF